MISHNDTLRDVRGKIGRAKELINSYNIHVIREFWGRDKRIHIGLDYDTNTGEHFYYFSRVPDFSKAIRRAGNILGDVVHNLRAALDQLVFQITLKDTGGIIVHPKTPQFPICDTPDDWDNFVWHIKEMSDKSRAEIERFQPYHGVDLITTYNFARPLFKPGVNPRAVNSPDQLMPTPHPLAVLRDLNDWDKHRRLAEMVITNGTKITFIETIQGLTMFYMGYQARQMFHNGMLDVQSVKLGTEIARGVDLKWGFPHSKVEMVGDISPEIILVDHVLLADDTIRAMLSIVKKITKALQPLA